jgi:peptidoglycan/xylan/chitin deacetylase (PgdA/CDA1 family)
MIKNPVPWPNRARCAVTFTWDMDSDSILHLAHPNDADTRISTNSMLRYGPEVGVPRIIEMCAEFGVKHTFFIPGWCAERCPKAIDLMVENGHEVGHHGYLHEYPNQMSQERERYWTERGFKAIEKTSGQKPRGYRAPWYQYSKYSTDILVELGFEYDCSLMGDDVPYLVKGTKGDLVELPGNWQLDDWPQFVHNHDLDYMMPIQSPQRAMEVYMAEFEAMWEYGGHWVNCFHPFCSGQVARLMMVRKMIQQMHERGGVWFATGEEVARHLRDCIASGTYTPRIDVLPYYEGRLSEFPPDYMPAG